MISQGSDIELKPISNRFKNLIAQHGPHWIVVSNPAPMSCFNNQMAVTCMPANNNKKFSNFMIKDIQ